MGSLQVDQRLGHVLERMLEDDDVEPRFETRRDLGERPLLDIEPLRPSSG